jgi:hypothetical protein
LKRAIEIAPSDSIILSTVGKAYELLNWPQQALESYRRSRGRDTPSGLEAEIERLDQAVGKF